MSSTSRTLDRERGRNLLVLALDRAPRLRPYAHTQCKFTITNLTMQGTVPDGQCVGLMAN